MKEVIFKDMKLEELVDNKEQIRKQVEDILLQDNIIIQVLKMGKKNPIIESWGQNPDVKNIVIFELPKQNIEDKKYKTLLQFPKFIEMEKLKQALVILQINDKQQVIYRSTFDKLKEFIK